MMEIVLAVIVFLVIAMAIVLVFNNIPKTKPSAPRPKISYPDPLPAPSKPEIVQGVNTADHPSHIHDEATTKAVAMQAHQEFVGGMNADELSESKDGGVMASGKKEYALVE